jgi:hypothetical protein
MIVSDRVTQKDLLRNKVSWQVVKFDETSPTRAGSYLPVLCKMQNFQFSNACPLHNASLGVLGERYI